MLAKEIENIKNLLKDIISDLNLINNGDFQSNFDNAKEKMQLFNEMKEKLELEYPIEDLRNYEHELMILTKQISKTYDNIIEVKKRQLKEVVFKIKLLQNRKKLINYSR